MTGFFSLPRGGTHVSPLAWDYIVVWFAQEFLPVLKRHALLNWPLPEPDHNSAILRRAQPIGVPLGTLLVVSS